MVCTLRVRPEDPDIMGHLRRTFSTLFELYGGPFDVKTTANAVLQSTTRNNPRFSVFYGQSFGSSEYAMAASATINRYSDVANLKTDFDLEDFAVLFSGNHDRSEVAIHSIISFVYIITAALGGWEQ